MDFIQVCSKAYVTPQFELVLKDSVKEIDDNERKSRLKSEILLGNTIGSLIGSEYVSNFLEFENDEIADFRRAAVR